MKFIGIIPARYASTRFPGKPLALLAGKPMIAHAAVLDDVCVATDDERILRAVEAFGGKAVMTSSEHKSGTDRIAEAVEKVGGSFDVVVNVQGDEPFVQKEQLESLAACFEEGSTQIATLMTTIGSTEELMSPNNVKVVCDQKGWALYFSRQPIPYLRGVAPEEWLEKHTYHKHVGIYAFRASTLKELVRLPQSVLELGESLEQLRWLENGYHIKVCQTQQANMGIDTVEDLEAAERYLTNRNTNNKI